MGSNTTNIYNQENYNLSFIRFTTVLLLRAGSLMVQMGMFPTENIYNIILQNLLDFAMSILSFITFGCFLSLGKNEVIGLMTYGSWIGSENVDTNRAIFGVCTVLIGSHIITCQTSGRLHILASVVVNVVYTVVLSLSMHWAWHPNGWMQRNELMGADVQFLDHGGGFIIYGCAGIAGSVGMLVLGRRLLRLHVIDESSIGAESLVSTILGHVLIYIGMLCMSVSSADIKLGIVSRILLTNVAAGAVGVVTSMLVQIAFCRGNFNYWALVRVAQGSLAAFVAIAPGVPYYSTLASLIIAFIGSVLFIVVCKVIQESACEDYCNCIGLYLINGLIGILLPQIFYKADKSFKIFYKNMIWQMLCCLVIITMYVVIFSALFCFLEASGCLRNRSDQVCHRRAQKLQVRMKRSFFARFFNEETKAVILEPGCSGKAVNRPSDIKLTGTTLEPDAATNKLVTKDGKANGGNSNSASNMKAQGEKSIFTLPGTGRNDGGLEQDCAASGEGCRQDFDEVSVIYKLDDLIVCNGGSGDTDGVKAADGIDYGLSHSRRQEGSEYQFDTD